MIAFVLAGGNGMRVWPAAETRNKAALPVGNIPLVRRVVEQLFEIGVENVVVGIGHHAPSVRHALHGLESSRIRFVETSRENGTAAAVARMLADTAVESDFLVVYGDVSTTAANYARVRETHAATGSIATVLAAPLGDEDCREWIGLRVSNGAVNEIQGHPRDGDHRCGGVFAFSPKAIPFLTNNPGIFRHVPVGGMPPVEADLCESVAQMLDEKLPVGAVLASDFLVDIDKPWHVLEANSRWTRWRLENAPGSIIPASCRIHDGADISGPLLLGENVEIGNRVVIRGGLVAGAETRIVNGPILDGGVVLGERVHVRDYCLIEGGSVCGDNGVYAHGSEFSGTAFDNVYLYHYCEIYGLLGSSVDIGAATVCGTLRFDDREAFHRVRGRREIPAYAANASYLGDYSRTGVNAILMPGCKVGAWSCVGPGVVLGDDLPNRKSVFVRQQLETKDWGPEKYGW